MKASTLPYDAAAHPGLSSRSGNNVAPATAKPPPSQRRQQQLKTQQRPSRPKASTAARKTAPGTQPVSFSSGNGSGAKTGSSDRKIKQQQPRQVPQNSRPQSAKQNSQPLSKGTKQQLEPQVERRSKLERNKQDPQAERRSKLERNKSGSNLVKKKKRPLPSRSKSQSSLWESSSTHVVETSAATNIELDSITEKNNQQHDPNRRQSRQGAKSKRMPRQQQQPVHRTGPRHAKSASGALDASASAGVSLGVKFTIADDTPKTHGKKLNIVPGIELYDDENSEHGRTQDESRRSAASGSKQSRDWSFQSLHTPQQSTSHYSKRAPLTPGALMSSPEPSSRASSVSQRSQNYQRQHFPPGSPFAQQHMNDITSFVAIDDEGVGEDEEEEDFVEPDSNAIVMDEQIQKNRRQQQYQQEQSGEFDELTMSPIAFPNPHKPSTNRCNEDQTSLKNVITEDALKVFQDLDVDIGSHKSGDSVQISTKKLSEPVGSHASLSSRGNKSALRRGSADSNIYNSNTAGRKPVPRSKSFDGFEGAEESTHRYDGRRRGSADSGSSYKISSTGGKAVLSQSFKGIDASYMAKRQDVATGSITSGSKRSYSLQPVEKRRRGSADASNNNSIAKGFEGKYEGKRRGSANANLNSSNVSNDFQILDGGYQDDKRPGTEDTSGNSRRSTSLQSQSLQELEVESMDGAVSTSSQQQNWEWLQSTLEQQEAEILRQKKSPPRPSNRQQSNEDNDAKSHSQRIPPIRQESGTLMLSENEGEAGPGPLERNPPRRQKSNGPGLLSKGAKTSTPKSTGRDVKAVRQRGANPSTLLAKKLSRQRAGGHGGSVFSSHTNLTMDDTIAGSEHLPESDLAEQMWMEEDDHSSSSDYSTSGDDVSNDEEGSMGEDSEEAIVRAYVERMQQERLNNNHPVPITGQLKTKKKAVAQPKQPSKDRDKLSELSPRIKEHLDLETSQSSIGEDDGDEEDSIDYMPNGYIASKSDRVAQMLEEMKRRDVTPSTPVVAKSSIMNGAATPTVDNYGVTPKATNITSTLKSAHHLKSPQMLEDLQESFTDLHIGIGSSQDSVANSSLSLSITSEDNWRKSQSTHHDSQEGSIRSSFNQSLTSINEDLELSGEQMEMLELGSKKPMRSKKKNMVAASVASQGSDGVGSAEENSRAMSNQNHDGQGNPSLSPTQSQDPPRQPKRNIGSAAGKLKEKPPPIFNDEHVTDEKEIAGTDTEGSPFDAQARMQLALDLARSAKADIVQRTTGSQANAGRNDNSRLEPKDQTVPRDISAGSTVPNKNTSQFIRSPTTHNSPSSSDSSSRYNTVEIRPPKPKKNEMPNVETDDMARFAQLDFASMSEGAEVQYADNATVLEEASIDDDTMPTLSDLEDDDAHPHQPATSELFAGKRRKPRKHIRDPMTSVSENDITMKGYNSDENGQYRGYHSDDTGGKNMSRLLFRSKKTSSTYHGETQGGRRKNRNDGSVCDTDSRSTTSNSVVDRLFRFGSSRKLLSKRQLYEGAELLDESESSMTSHHSL